MSKAVLMSMNPKQCELVASGEQTVIVRKTKPKLETPFKVYIYCTENKNGIANCKGNEILNGKVIGEFVCDKIDGFNYAVHEPFDASNWQDCYKGYLAELYDMEGTCLSVKEINNYGGGRFLYTWHISNLVIYDKPKQLDEFYIWKKCNSCRTTGYESSACIYDEDCKVPAIITSPPKSFCYVEELK